VRPQLRQVLKAGFLFSFCSAVAICQSLSSFTCSPSVPAGSTAVCTVSLTVKAPTTGFPVAIRSTGTGLSFPATVTVPIYAYSAQFNVLTTTATPAQTAVMSATAASITKTAPLAVTAPGSYSISQLTCTPATLIPGSSAKCIAALSAAAPTGGIVVGLSSSNATLLWVPSSALIPAGSPLVEFTATTSMQISTVQQVTLTATIPTDNRTLTVKIDPTPLFHLDGSTTEITSATNGAAVYPTTAPPAWRGTLTERGSGSLSFVPTIGSSGVSFREGGAQNANAAFINFTGDAFGGLFDADGEISFSLKSAYSFAERKALPAPAYSFAFEVFDNTAAQFHFMSYVSSGQLAFGYSTRGVSAFYVVPVGKEDALFGRGVVANVRIVWAGNTSALYINNQLVRTATFTPRVASWSSVSALTIGSRSTRFASGGYYSSVDAIADFKVR
jgi:hypothetical protein